MFQLPTGSGFAVRHRGRAPAVGEDLVRYVARRARLLPFPPRRRSSRVMPQGPKWSGAPDLFTAGRRGCAARLGPAVPASTAFSDGAPSAPNIICLYVDQLSTVAATRSPAGPRTARGPCSQHPRERPAALGSRGGGPRRENASLARYSRCWLSLIGRPGARKGVGSFHVSPVSSCSLKTDFPCWPLAGTGYGLVVERVIVPVGMLVGRPTVVLDTSVSGHASWFGNPP